MGDPAKQLQTPVWEVYKKYNFWSTYVSDIPHVVLIASISYTDLENLLRSIPFHDKGVFKLLGYYIQKCERRAYRWRHVL